ncbi:choice-of-anchor B family protein [Lewinella sp. 4G2]|uniref:choice-of-anchor B family protein n=1 Tax=Lewinella sp. 4G2 TaxID=1803372 RepID=UPI0007B4EABE|nr:choice-of-anchor B family protein [Lewinella sp. 4G2]OAV42776.1 hypothetical protein A3850_016190 [Lewinella sp. 4G2]
MKRFIPVLTCLSLLLALLPGTRASAQESDNMFSLGSWDDPTLAGQPNQNRYSDVWGYARDGREYALIASRFFIHVLDVTDPANITEISRLNVVLNSQSTWRDIKVHGDYAYCVTEGNEGLQIIDLSGLPNSVSVPYQSTEFFTRCHNIFIDSTSSPVRLYAVGTQVQRQGYIVLDISNPIAPVEMASVNLTGGYVHDAYAINDTLYANSEGRGMYVYDVSTPTNPRELGILSNYAEQGYNHSVWRTDDAQHVVMCDETSNTGVKVVSVADPTDMEVTSLFRSASLAPNSVRSLAHNPYVLGDSLVVLSYYGEGVQVWDITDRNNASRRGFFDTTPNANTYSRGVWGCYPYLPSGNILASDQYTGLHVVRIDRSLPVTYSAFEVSADTKAAYLNWEVSEQRDNAGFTVEHALADGQFADVAWVPAAGDTYSFDHDYPGPGLHYYRLRQRDLDGTEHYSEVRSVTFGSSSDAANITAFPNPAPINHPIVLRGADAGAKWGLWAADGRLVARGRGNRIEANVAPGIYHVRVDGAQVTTVVISR